MSRQTSNPFKIYQISSTVENGEVTGEELFSLLSNKVEQGCVYVILDHAVALGTYRQGKLQLGMGLERKIIGLGSSDFLVELRVFSEFQEFRAVRLSNGHFHWRNRIDGEGNSSNEIDCLDEVHKLWGIAKTGTDKNGWSLLSSERGSRIYYPGSIPAGGGQGLIVRNYMQFKSVGATAADQTNEVDVAGRSYQYVDSRFVCFQDWQTERKED